MAVQFYDVEREITERGRLMGRDHDRRTAIRHSLLHDSAPTAGALHVQAAFRFIDEEQ